MADVPDPIALIRRRFRHPYQGARLDTLGHDASLRGDLMLFELDLLTVQMDLDEAVNFETPDGLYLKWERVADVVEDFHHYSTVRA